MTDGLETTGCDALVVGAGVIGLAAAWRIAERGASVIVVDRDEPAAATRAAAGMLAPVTEADFGEEELLALNLAGAARWPSFARELEGATGEPLGFRRRGALVVAADRDDAEALRRLHAHQRALGLDAAWLAPGEARRLEPALSPRIAGAISAPHEAQVDPQAVARALRSAASSAGATLATGDVREVLSRGDAACGVALADGRRIEAAHVVLAAGAWGGRIAGVPPAAGLARVRPVKGQVLSLRGRAGEPLAERVVRTPRCYVVDRGDGRVVVGATMEERGFSSTVTVEAVRTLLEAAWEVLPEVEQLEFAGARAGLRPGSPDNAPLVGAAGLDGLLVATGHHRNGVLLAPLTGEALAALCAGEPAPAELAPFAPGRLGGGRAALEALSR